MELFRKYLKLESNQQIYERVQILKQKMMRMLEEDPVLKKQITRSRRHKILMVTHSRVMQAFTSEGVRKSDDGFVGEQYFQNCEVYPADLLSRP